MPSDQNNAASASESTGKAMPDKRPWHDCPDCPKCPNGAVIRVEPLKPNHLMCAACGNDFEGNDAEYAQATKADEAYDEAYEKGLI